MKKTKLDKKSCCSFVIKKVKLTDKEQAHTPDGTFTMKLGNTTFTVDVHLEKNNKPTLKNKINCLLASQLVKPKERSD